MTREDNRSWFSEQQNAAPEIAALRYLERYTNHVPVGDEHLFDFMTASACSTAAIQLYRSVVEDSKVALSFRLFAAAHILCLSKIARNITVDSQWVSEILAHPCQTRFECIAMITFVRTVIADPFLWPFVHRKANRCITKICHDHGLTRKYYQGYASYETYLLKLEYELAQLNTAE